MPKLDGVFFRDAKTSKICDLSCTKVTNFQNSKADLTVGCTGSDLDEFSKTPPPRVQTFATRSQKKSKRYLLVRRIGKKPAEELDYSLLDIAKQLEAAALKDDYFAERKLYPNVDFYTGVIYKAMGFTPKMFTPMFAIGRLPGWIAHWREMMADDSTRIGRPQQVYIGATERSV